MIPGGRTSAIHWRVCALAVMVTAGCAWLVHQRADRVRLAEMEKQRASASAESRANADARSALERTNQARLLAGQAAAFLRTGAPGQRLDSLKMLAAAASVLGNLPGLRNDAVAALLLPDLVRGPSKPERDEPGLRVGFDPSLASDLFLGDDGQIRAIHRRKDIDAVTFEHPTGVRARELLPPVGSTNRFVAVRYANRDVIYWNVEFVAPVHRFTNTAPGSVVAASANGNTALLARPERGGVETLRIESNVRQVRWIPLEGVVSASPTSDGSEILATTASDPGLRVIRLVDGVTRGIIPLRSRAVRWCVSATAPWLCVLDTDGRLTTWDVESLRPLRELPGVWPMDSRIGFLPSGNTVAAAGWLGQLHLVDPLSGHVWLSASALADGLQFGADGREWVSGAPRGKAWATGLVEWMRPYTEFAALGPNSNPTLRRIQHGLAFSPDSNLIAAAGEGGVVVWDLRQRHRTEVSLTGPAFSAAWNATGNELEIQSATGGHHLSIEVSGGAVKLGGLQSLDRYTNDCRLAARSIDGKGRAFWSKDRLVTLVAGRRALELPMNVAPEHIALAPDASLLCGTLPNGELIVWKTLDGTRIWRTNGIAPQRVTFAPDGRWLVSGNGEAVQFWSVPGFMPGRRIARGGEFGTAAVMAFSPDSTTLACTMTGSELGLVAVGSGEILVRLPNPNGWQVTTLGFDATGRFLAAGSLEGVMTVWDLQRLRTQLAEIGLNWADEGR